MPEWVAILIINSGGNRCKNELLFFLPPRKRHWNICTRCPFSFIPISKLSGLWLTPGPERFISQCWNQNLTEGGWVQSRNFVCFTQFIRSRVKITPTFPQNDKVNKTNCAWKKHLTCLKKYQFYSFIHHYC